MSKLLATEILERDAFSPRERYTVALLDTKAEWHKWPCNERPQRFRTLKGAVSIRDAALSGEGCIAGLIFREATVFFSDRETQEVHSLTEYVGVVTWKTVGD